MLGFPGLFIVLFIPNFFLLGPLRNVNFTASLTQAKGLSVFLITYFTAIQTGSYIFHISTLLRSSAGLRITQLMMFIYQKLLKH